MKTNRLLVCGVVLTSAAALASGFNLDTQGARASGMGGAVAGLTDDATALYFNPAGLTGRTGFEAQLGGSAAIVSYHRLTQEFYGLPADDALLLDRTAKEAIHEIGHAAGLTHCDDYQCVMAASHAVEWLDVKSAALCAFCRRRL